MTEQQRKPIGFANYRGKCSAEFEVPMGPNYIGELMWPVSVEYDADLDRTRIGFSLIPPAVTA